MRIIGNLIELFFLIIHLLKHLTKYILFTFWIQVFSRLFICPLKDHDWRFIGGGWIFTSKHSLQCKRCGKCTNDWSQVSQAPKL